MKSVRNLLVVSMFLVGSFSAFAQEEISDEDLYKYALLEQVVDYMKKDISKAINGMIKNQEGIDGKRYKELAGAKGDEAKLAEMNATDFEKQFLTLVDEEKAKRIDAIKVVNQELATKMVGDRGTLYKSIKDALKADADLKARYDAIKANLQMQSDS